MCKYLVDYSNLPYFQFKCHISNDIFQLFRVLASKRTLTVTERKLNFPYIRKCSIVLSFPTKCIQISLHVFPSPACDIADVDVVKLVKLVKLVLSP